MKKIHYSFLFTIIFFFSCDFIPMTENEYNVYIASPTVTLTSTEGFEVDLNEIPIEIEFSKKINDFNESDIVIINGSLNTLTKLSDTLYRADIIQTGSIVTIEIPEGVAYCDYGSYNLAAPPLEISIVRIPPTAILTSLLDEDSYSGEFQVEINFSESVSGFELSDISKTNCSVSNLVSVDTSNYLVDITPTGKIISISINADAVYDSNNNLNLHSEILEISLIGLNIGEISQMCWSNDEKYIYACDSTNNLLYKIDIEQEIIISYYELSAETPTDMTFSESENKIYIVYLSSSLIDIFDISTETFSTYEFTLNTYIKDIEIDSTNRKLLILSNGSLSMLDVDTGSIILDNDTSIRGRKMVINPSEKLIYSTETGYSPSSMYRYSYQDDTITLLESTRYVGSNGRDITISPDMNIICRPSGGGNGPGYTVYAIDPLDYTNTYGEWDIGTYPIFVFFNPVTDVLYGTNGDPYDNYLHIMDINTYEEIDKIAFPNSHDVTVFTTNITGTKAVGFSYNTYSDTGYKLYFFDDI